MLTRGEPAAPAVVPDIAVPVRAPTSRGVIPHFSGDTSRSNLACARALDGGTMRSEGRRAAVARADPPFPAAAGL